MARIARGAADMIHLSTRRGRTQECGIARRTRNAWIVVVVDLEVPREGAYPRIVIVMGVAQDQRIDDFEVLRGAAQIGEECIGVVRLVGTAIDDDVAPLKDTVLVDGIVCSVKPRRFEQSVSWLLAPEQN